MEPLQLRRARTAVTAGFFLQGLVFAAIVTQVPRLQDDLGIGEGAVTGILVLVAVVSGVGSVVAGSVAAHRTSATALTVGLLGIATGAVLVGVAPGVGWLVAAFAAYGLGLGAVDAGMNMQGVRVQAALGRSVMGAFHGWWSVGGIVGAGYASACAALDVAVGLDLAAVAVVAVVVTWRSSSSFVRARDVDPGPSVDGPSVAGTVPPWRPVLVFGAVIGIFYAADTGTLTWSSVYLDDALAAPGAVVPLGYAAYQVGALVSRFGGDLLVRRWGSARVVATATSVGVLGLVTVVASPAPVVAIVGFGITGLGLAILAPLSFAAVSSAVPARAVDVAVARMNLANYAGAILGGGVIGAAATSGLLRWAFVIPLALVPLVWLSVRAFAAAGQPRRGRVGT